MYVLPFMDWAIFRSPSVTSPTPVRTMFKEAFDWSNEVSTDIRLSTEPIVSPSDTTEYARY